MRLFLAPDFILQLITFLNSVPSVNLLNIDLDILSTYTFIQATDLNAGRLDSKEGRLKHSPPVGTHPLITLDPVI